MTPLLIRLAPLSLKTAIYYRLYRSRRMKWLRLYEAASLRYAPHVRMRLSSTDEGHGNIAFTGFYEHQLTKLLSAKARMGGLLVDVGANYGYFSLLWAAQNSQNRVVAFEASPRNHPALTRNVNDNGFANVITVRPVAVGKDQGQLRFSLGPDEQTGWGGISLGLPEGAEVTVPVVRLDDEISGDISIDVLKIDIEGADTWAIMGAENLLKQKRIKQIYYEENKPRMKLLGIAPGDAQSYLQSFGYRVAAVGNSNGAIVEYSAMAPN